jgi:hypothetical protein
MKPVDEASTEHLQIEGTAFETEVAATVAALRSAIAEVIQRLRPPVRRSTELRRLLDLGQKLSWSLFTAATTTDPATFVSLMPGRRGMESFLEASALHGVPAEAIEAARSAFERFEGAVVRLAGSRDAFESMVSELGTADESRNAPGADLKKHRRSAFRAMSMIWGRQARVVCGARIVHPSQTPGMLDTVFVTGMVGLHRTRRAGPLHMTEYRARKLPAGAGMAPPPEPLDPRETGPNAIGLLRDFCSQPLPDFQLRESQQGYRRHELVSSELGPAGDATYFTGVVGRADAPAPKDGAVADAYVVKAIDFPIETFFGDILLHKSLCGDLVPEVGVYALPQDGAMVFREWDRLPVAEQGEDLGDGLYAARTPLIPQYPDVLTYALERVGWNPEEFRVFRLCVEYPVLASRIVMRMK